MVVGVRVAVLINITSQDSMGKRIALAACFPASVEECVLGLSCDNGVEHYGIVAAGGVLHTNGDSKTAGGKAVLLILYGTCAYCNIGKDIGKISVVLGVEHFICTHKTCFGKSLCVELSDRDKALKHILTLGGVWLMYHSLIALTGGSGLIGINSGDNKYLVLYLILNLCKAVNVIKNAVLSVGRAGTDDKQELIRLACKNISDLGISFSLDLLYFFGDRELLLDILRDRQLPDEIHIHHSG